MNNQTDKVFKITDPRMFRMAHVCMAKDHVWTYLNYILIDLDQGIMVGTDGHRLIRAKCINPNGLTGRYLIRPEKAIPKSWIDIVINPERHTLTAIDQKGNEVSMTCVCKAETDIGKFPNIDRIIPDQKVSRKATESIAFSTALIADIAKAGELDYCHSLLNGPDNAILVQFGEFAEDLVCVLLPARRLPE